MWTAGQRNELALTFMPLLDFLNSVQLCSWLDYWTLGCVWFCFLFGSGRKIHVSCETPAQPRATSSVYPTPKVLMQPAHAGIGQAGPSPAACRLSIGRAGREPGRTLTSGCTQAVRHVHFARRSINPPLRRTSGYKWWVSGSSRAVFARRADELTIHLNLRLSGFPPLQTQIGPAKSFDIVNVVHFASQQHRRKNLIKNLGCDDDVSLSFVACWHEKEKATWTDFGLQGTNQAPQSWNVDELENLITKCSSVRLY